jgi:Uma2 family endonuclease
LPEPGIEVPGSPEFSSDVAGWRRQRLPELPQDGPIQTVPDWLCEIHSPNTRGYDLLKKRPFYARIGVAWLWYVDVEARTVTVSKLVDGAWLEAAVHGEDEHARLQPFGDVEIVSRAGGRAPEVEKLVEARRSGTRRPAETLDG